MSPTADELQDELLDRVRALPYEQQRRVLDFARALTNMESVRGSGHALLTFDPGFSAEDVRQMAESIEEGCEQIDPNEW